MVSLGGLASHWKLLALMSTISIAGGKGVYTYVTDVETRLDTIEVLQKKTVTELGKVKCMIILHHMGEDPMECELVEQ
jgi:hypothetical protein